MLPLYPSSWLCMVVALFDQSRPISDGADKVASVDVVESVLLKSPVLLCIINLEFAIRGNPVRLYRTQICANDFGTFELYRHQQGHT